MVRIMNIFDAVSNLAITFGLAVIVLAEIASSVTIIAALLAMVFWTIRIRREVKQNYSNSIIKYIKSIFKK